MSDWDDSRFHQNLAWVLFHLLHIWKISSIFAKISCGRTGKGWGGVEGERCNSSVSLSHFWHLEKKRDFSFLILCLVLTKMKKKIKKIYIYIKIVAGYWKNKVWTKVLCSQKVFHFSLNFSFMEIINIFVGFHLDLEQNWTSKPYSFPAQSSGGPPLQCQTSMGSGGWQC